jgi:hypothetical protein
LKRLPTFFSWNLQIIELTSPFIANNNTKPRLQDIPVSSTIHMWKIVSFGCTIRNNGLHGHEFSDYQHTLPALATR